MRNSDIYGVLIVCGVFLICMGILVFAPREVQPVSISMTSKSRIVFKCIDGKLYGDTYLYVGRDINEDVSKYPRGKNELVIEDGIEISCKNKETKWKLDF